MLEHRPLLCCRSAGIPKSVPDKNFAVHRAYRLGRDRNIDCRPKWGGHSHHLRFPERSGG
ncbi:unnamed protein product [Symbiodinium sp. CCMP2592]|nr:unnamed protein product [Symbiodinium sp. CCMP2592]